MEVAGISPHTIFYVDIRNKNHVKEKYRRHHSGNWEQLVGEFWVTCFDPKIKELEKAYSIFNSN